MSSYGITPVFYKNYTAFKAKKEDGSRKYKYIINTGSSRSSKTYSILELIHRICENNKNTRVTAWRDTKKDCRDTIWKDYQKILLLSERLNYQNRNKTEATYYFPEKESSFEFHGTDDEEKVHGLTQQIAWLNEPYKISKETFDQIDMRSDVIFIDWNPKKSHWIEDLSKQDNAVVIHSTYKDNPFCPVQSKIKIESYQTIKQSNVVIKGLISEANAKNYNLAENPLKFETKDFEELRRCIHNENAGTADPYKWSVYGLGLKSEKPNRIYKDWKEITEQEFNQLQENSYFGLDFGINAPTTLIEIKYDQRTHTFFVKPRLYKPMSEMISIDGNGIVREFEQLRIEKNVPIIVDSADKDNRLILQRNGYNVISAIKGIGSVSSGIALIQQSNISYVYDEDFVNEYENYEWEIINGFNLDRPLKRDDHYLDAMRYCITWLYKYLNIK